MNNIRVFGFSITFSRLALLRIRMFKIGIAFDLVSPSRFNYSAAVFKRTDDLFTFNCGLRFFPNSSTSRSVSALFTYGKTNV